MEQSILASVKKVIGAPSDYDAFDEDIIMHINMVFNTLNDLGVGPAEGFMIEDDTAKWADYIPSNDNRVNSIKTFIYLSVRMIFDPPRESWVVTSLEKQLDQLAWRINVRQEATNYFHDDPRVDVALPVDKRPFPSYDVP
jgi:hypothetical protein